MVLSKPLSYGCTRHIIKHTDPNSRILLSLRCPSIQAFEKTIPFKCRKLRFSRNKISMDGCYYKLEIVEKESENFLQLTVKHRGREYVERVQNKERTLFFFYHYINNLLFGGRSEPLRVKRLEINVNFMCIPSSVKYHTKEVDFGVNRGFEIDILKKIVDASSLPLNFYAFGYFSEYWTIPEHPEFRSARSVFIRNEDDNQPDLFRHILELPNKNISVQSRLSWITFQTIIDNWKRTQRKVGTSLMIERVHTDDVENILNQILQEWQHCENKNGDFIIPLYQDKNLRITYGDTHKELPSDPRLWNNLKNFLKLEVIDVDSE